MRGQSQERTLDGTLGHSKELEGLGQENPETRWREVGDWKSGTEKWGWGQWAGLEVPWASRGAGCWADMGIP